MTQFARRNWPLLAVVLVVAAAFVLVLADRWRRGALVLGGAMVLAALLRAALSPDRVGLLAVRGKGFDVAAMAVVGATIIALAASIDPLGTD
ncbi:DUF3017 domain-containing protein [Rhodococcus hoagii]|uniref:DUF3017 domain-containing protein n=3 Tax=Rhodococcus hoagii TaxID=43767 RepID=E9T314_RHOHA|nr:DUF3017 domain-containing protein [Prescottella equi]MBU4614155.1 DUF3017 domain-containing protein [Rhodococcus sp. GG48]MCD7051017.1 DUF3017 domain-containing protein [Rhodococcus sp. BH2-1]GBF12797.1 hypothetical protein Br6_00139 [Rhodococcus sp. Br-6]EGD23226.1 hypothetical protein HMPREF0724_13043 [Prescottella equi ATCC 33707]ERN44351.1 hypothetical protein H849_17665 [Prescottella equi NBRC 101255 = C 7]